MSSEPQATSTSESLNNNNNLYSLYKELKFDRKRHRDDVIRKCAEFWRYVYTRPDITPVQAKLLVKDDCQQCDDYNPYCGCSDTSRCKKTHRRWLTTLMVLHSIGCDKVAINSTKQCKLCEQNDRIFNGLFTNEDPKHIEAQHEQIKELSKWQANPMNISKNMYESHRKQMKHNHY